MSVPGWVTIERAPDFPKWEAEVVEYYPVDAPCNNGSVNTYVRVENEKGDYLSGIKVYQDWGDDRASELMKPIVQANDFCDDKYGATFFMSGDSSFDPAKGQSGPYSFYVDGNSDVVKGLGLPLKRHVQYAITWRYKSEPTPPPTEGHWVVENPTELHSPRLRWVE